ncbi:MAG: hypothetical protein KDC98_22240 [Planctomycetes bacterium]|nr:hypothetical protein [Planctomycetota bacterium]
MRTSRISILVGALMLAACQSPPIELATPASQVFASMPHSEFPGAGSLLSGFDSRHEDGEWRAGDEVLFGLRLKKGSTVHRWLLLLSVIGAEAERGQAGTGDGPGQGTTWQQQWTFTAEIDGKRRQIPITSEMCRVAVRVCDENGAQLGRSEVELPCELMSHGLLAGIECALAHQRNGADFQSFASEAEVRPMAIGLVSLIALLQVVQNDDVLEDYFWLVVQKPSVWSVIKGMGVAASLRASPERSTPVSRLPPALPAAWPAYAMPLRVDVNDTAALLADVIAVQPTRPYALCAGIVAAAARHPTQQDLRFDVQLLAARLGRQ